MTIDAHIHVFPDYTAEQHLTIARAAGVTRTVIIQPGGSKFDNSYMLAAVKAYPGVFSAVAIVDVDAPDLDAVIAALYKQHVRGFRISARKEQPWMEWAGMNRLWTIAAKRKMTICPLINPDVFPWVAAMCERHKETLVAVDHLGRVGATGTIVDAEVRALCGLAKYPRVHVKVSAFYALGKKQAPYTDLGSMIRQVFETYGPRRLLWGSDAPYQTRAPHNYQASVDLIRQGLPFLRDDDKQWLLWRNSERLFFRG
ncbi:MAG: amidohydrolase family protein [Bryobacteraceae bacterium]